jgi:hypothetical protein
MANRDSAEASVRIVRARKKSNGFSTGKRGSRGAIVLLKLFLLFVLVPHKTTSIFLMTELAALLCVSSGSVTFRQEAG